jgi:hypothetical protein
VPLNKKQVKIVLSILLILFVIYSIANYNVQPNNAYKMGDINLIKGGSFENFNETVLDCCNKNPNLSSINGEKSKESIFGEYSLNLTSQNQCACINLPIPNLDKNYLFLISFYTKGDNPKYCHWNPTENRCISSEEYPKTENWLKHIEISQGIDSNTPSSVYFYADSDGTKTVTNLYDDLQVRKLIPIEEPYNYNESEEYIIKTKADNHVNGERISDIENGEAYFITKGEPKVTIKFPITELITILIMLIIIIRLTKHEKH